MADDSEITDEGIDALAREASELAEKAVECPWMVYVDWLEGSTYFSCATHVEAAIALGRECWEEGHSPPGDDYGYSQPDGHEYCDPVKIATARLIAHAGTHYAALARAVLERGEEIRRLREVAEAARQAYDDCEHEHGGLREALAKLDGAKP